MNQDELLQAILQEVQGLKETTTSIDKRLENVEQEVQGLKETTTAIDERLKEVELVQENVTNKNIQLLLEGQKGMNDKFRRLDELEEKVEDIQIDISALKSLTVKK